MKKLIPILTVVLATLFVTPDADARGYSSRSYVSHHRSCGGPAWIETYVAYYANCGRPVYRTRIIPIRRPYHRSYHRPHYPVRRSVCR